MAEELTQADIDAEKAELEELEAKLAAKGMKIVDIGSGKPLYKSKIFWANMIAIAGMVIDQFGNQYLSPEQFALILGGALPMVNIVLRYMNKDISGVVS
jgi:hypothetical protein